MYELMLFIGGIITGATLMYMHYSEVTKATVKERNRYQSKIQELESEHMATVCSDAYRRGKEDGRLNPVTAAEQFAKTFEDRRVQFRSMKE